MVSSIGCAQYNFLIASYLTQTLWNLDVSSSIRFFSRMKSSKCCWFPWIQEANEVKKWLTQWACLAVLIQGRQNSSRGSCWRTIKTKQTTSQTFLEEKEQYCLFSVNKKTFWKKRRMAAAIWQWHRPRSTMASSQVCPLIQFVSECLFVKHYIVGQMNNLLSGRILLSL